MRRLLLLGALLFLALPASAEETLLDEVGFSAIVDAAQEVDGFDAQKTVRALIEGELPLDGLSPERIARALGHAVRENLLSLLAALGPVYAASLFIRLLFGDDSRGSRGLRVFCRTACASLLAARYAGMRNSLEAFLGTLARLTETMTPVLASALTLAGGTTSASFLSPLSALCVGLIEKGIAGLGLRLCGVAAAAAIAGGLTQRLRLQRLFSLARFVMRAGIGVVTAAFMGLLWVQGLLGSGRDSVALRAARLAVENLVPMIGGDMSDTMDSLAGSALIVRNAVGVTGLLLLLSACAAPILSLTSTMLSMKLAAAILENAGDRNLTEMTAGFAEVMEMLLTAAAGGVALALLLAGATLAALG